MSDKQYFQEDHPTIQLRVWALGQMVWGAFLAGAVLIAFVVVYYVVLGIGALLPEESKQAPSPYSQLEMIELQATAVV